MEDNFIKSVDPTSPLCGKVQIGDTIVSINGNEILDVLDYKFFAYDRELDVCLQRPDGTRYSLGVKKREGGDLGLDFESYLMDAPRACSNACSEVTFSAIATVDRMTVNKSKSVLFILYVLGFGSKLRLIGSKLTFNLQT